jgi:ABC-type antimicrobial peptide transport system permease subunit
VLVMLAAVVAAYVPTRRALGVEPIVSLKSS